MKIRGKLFSLASSTVLLCSAAVLIFVFLVKPLEEIEKERGYLERLMGSAYSLQNETNLMLTRASRSKERKLEAAKAEFLECNEDMGNIVLLPRLNLTIQTALNIITRLSLMSNAALEMLESTTGTMFREVENAVKRTSPFYDIW